MFIRVLSVSFVSYRLSMLYCCVCIELVTVICHFKASGCTWEQNAATCMSLALSLSRCLVMLSTGTKLSNCKYYSTQHSPSVLAAARMSKCSRTRSIVRHCCAVCGVISKLLGVKPGFIVIFCGIVARAPAPVTIHEIGYFYNNNNNNDNQYHIILLFYSILTLMKQLTKRNHKMEMR